MIGQFLTHSLLDFLFLLFIYEFRNYRLLKRAQFIYRENGIKYYRIESNDPNGITIKSIVFGKNVVIIGKGDNSVLAHEEGHLHQPVFNYYFLIASAFAIGYNVLTVPLLLIIYKILFWHFERDADIYAFHKYNVKFESNKERPNRRIERLKGWLFDTHPPDWVRKEEEYYKKTNILKLFIRDLLS